VGSALHEHMRDRIALGITPALVRLPDIAKAWRLGEQERGIFEARARHFKWTPPDGAVPEQALCLFADGEVRAIKGGRGDYEMPEGALLPATVDVMWSEPEPLQYSPGTALFPAVAKCPPGSTLWVVEVKTGLDIHVSPVEHNGQARVGALLAARWTGAETVVPAIVYWRKGDGEWDVPERVFGKDDLGQIWLEINDTLREVDSQEAKLHVGLPLDFVEGPHCAMCSCEARCAAKTALIKGVLDAPAPLGDAPLTVDEARRLAAILPALARFQKQATSALRAHVKVGGPVDLGNGNHWGPHAVDKTEVLADVGQRVLADEVGAELAESSVKRVLTRDAIEDAVRESHAEKGIKRQMAPTVRRLFARIGAEGGLVSRREVHWSAYREVPSLEEQLKASVEKEET
jgi:hypothetical protein